MIKRAIRKRMEKLTGRKCSRCQHNVNGRCAHPEKDMFARCWNGVFFRPGFKQRPRRYLRYEHTSPVLGRASVEETSEGIVVKVEPLTPEQQHQLEKIKATLQDAAAIACESGLLTED